VIRIAVLGDRDVGKVTHRELDAALRQFPEWAHGEWVATDSDVPAALDRADGVWIASGGPYRDDDAVYAAIELARSLAGIDAHHAEADPDADALVAAPLACSLIGEERPVTCVPGTRLAELCGTEPFVGFHWCNYGLADAFVDALTAAGVVVGAHAPDAGVEGLELPDHPFFVATLFQPQVGALAGRPLHPLIEALLDAGRDLSGRELGRQAARSAPAVLE
jgi:hypothetical protein